MTKQTLPEACVEACCPLVGGQLRNYSYVFLRPSIPTQIVNVNKVKELIKITCLSCATEHFI